MDAPIFFDPATPSVAIGHTLNLAIKTSVPASQAVSGVQAFINYDPAYLTVVDNDNSTPGIQIMPGTALPMVLLNSANVTAGTIDFSAGKLGEPFPTGTFIVATIQFRALAVTNNTTTVAFSFAAPRTTAVDYAGGHS